MLRHGVRIGEKYAVLVKGRDCIHACNDDVPITPSEE